MQNINNGETQFQVKCGERIVGSFPDVVTADQELEHYAQENTDFGNKCFISTVTPIKKAFIQHDVTAYQTFATFFK